jgi:hypothetical protein
MSEAAGRVATPSLPRALLALALVRCCLKVRGFGRTIAFAHKISQRQTTVPVTGESPLVDLTLRAVVRAAAIFPGRAVCLEQALALFILLRRRGVEVDLRLGVQPFPFIAHAWVELRGQPIGEDAEALRHLLPLPEVPA